MYREIFVPTYPFSGNAVREGRIEGLNFLASCICDLGLEAVDWARRWIAAHGPEPL